MSGPRMHGATQQVLRALIDDPTQERYGLEICHAAGLAPGTVQPILTRLEGLKWLESRWEDIDPSDAGRPRRRYYCLTPDGAELARNALVRAEQKSAQRARLRMRPGLAGGEA